MSTAPPLSLSVSLSFLKHAYSQLMHIQRHRGACVVNSVLREDHLGSKKNVARTGGGERARRELKREEE